MAVPGIMDNDQLEENMKAMTVPFNDTDQKILAAQLEYIRPLYCRMCGSCSGKCPKGLPVADMIRYLSYSEGYGQYQLARESFLSLPQEVRDVRCKDCGSCAIQCPNGVEISERLQIAQELLA
jgi:predicted aldo/keto reductase-like oxidoreductase